MTKESLINIVFIDNLEKKSDSLKDAIEHIIFHCGSFEPSETVSILSDPDTAGIANQFESIIKEKSDSVIHHSIKNLNRHGQEPPRNVAESMADSDLIISLCTWSLAHSNARLRASEAGARFLSLPFYSKKLLSDAAIMVDYLKVKPTVEYVTDRLSEGKLIHITSQAGTDITLKIDGRKGNCCPGIVQEPGELGSPPDIEANIAPLEFESEGVVCIDGSITSSQIGLLKKPVFLTVQNGKIINIESTEPGYEVILNKMLGDLSSPRRVLAECGIGLNPLAKLSGIMLTDEGVMGAVHFGFGSNSTIGGENSVDFHLDFVFKKPTLFIDSEKIIDCGELIQ